MHSRVKTIKLKLANLGKKLKIRGSKMSKIDSNLFMKLKSCLRRTMNYLVILNRWSKKKLICLVNGTEKIEKSDTCIVRSLR
jgi:hypothetical protein